MISMFVESMTIGYTTVSGRDGCAPTSLAGQKCRGTYAAGYSISSIKTHAIRENKKIVRVCQMTELHSAVVGTMYY